MPARVDAGGAPAARPPARQAGEAGPAMAAGDGDDHGEPNLSQREGLTGGVHELKKIQIFATSAATSTSQTVQICPKPPQIEQKPP